MRYHKTSNLISRRLQFEDIVFEVSGGSKGQPVGRALFISQQILNAFNKDVICASFCKLLRANKNILHPYLFYLHLLNIYTNGKIDQYQVQSTGITNFKFEQFLNNEILVIPPTALQEKFCELALPMINLTQVLGARNANLRRTRDLLLPKLISGKTDVETLDIDIPDIPEPEAQQEMATVVQPEPIDASQLALLF
jgi:type I restriction enzyme S subunit